MFGLVEFWAQRTVSPLDRREGWTVVDDRYLEHQRTGEYLRVLIDGEGRSPGTARTYAGRLALYLTWAVGAGVEETSPTVEQLAGFARWLERTPSRKHRPGGNRRQHPGSNVSSLVAARSPVTVDGILITAVEFVRFAASRGWSDAAAAEALSVRAELRFPPPRWDRGERAGRAVVTRRRVRRRRVEQAPAILTRDQVGALVDACGNVRDRFVVEALYATGLRVAELCGMRLADVHLVPSAVHLGCKVAGPHVHVLRREDNENRALAKSAYPRTVPVTKDLVWLHDAYRMERDARGRGGRERLSAGEPVAGASGAGVVGGLGGRTVRAPVGQGGLPGPSAHVETLLRVGGGIGDQGPGAGQGPSRACLCQFERRLYALPLGRHASRGRRSRPGGGRCPMSRQAGAALVEVPVLAPVSAPGDWRVERIVSLIDDRWLAGEWDPERLLLVPDPEGRLSRDRPCVVAGCRNVRRGVDPLCHAHRRRFDRCGSDDLDAWLASDGPMFKRRWVSEETCAVTGESGDMCPRPVAGRWQLCHAHDSTWREQRSAGRAFEEFLRHALPLPSFGPCVVASCYLAAAHRRVRLCALHHRLWHDAGCPRYAAFEAWAARARQPVNHRVLSLRGLPELVRLELLYAIGCRVNEQVRTSTGNMRRYIDELLASGVGSIVEFDLAGFDPTGNHDWGRFARFSVDRVRLAYGDAGSERAVEVWDLRHFGASGRLDFTRITQPWLREATKSWAAAALANRNHQMVRHRVQSVAVLSRVLAGGHDGGRDPSGLSRVDVDRFLMRVRTATSSTTGHSPGRAATIVEDCAFVLREAREMGLLPDLAPTFAIRRGDSGRKIRDEEPGRALPAHVVAQLDSQVEVLRAVPGSTGGPAHRSLGAIGERAGDMAVLSYLLLKSTGRRVGEVASLHLECLDVDEAGKAVLIYDNHKAMRMRRRLPLADSALVETIRSQQAWVSSRFPDTAPGDLWLLPRGTRNVTGTAHVPAGQLAMWMRVWVSRIDRIDAGGVDSTGEPLAFTRSAIHPHAFRHTYAQTLADQGVAAPVLRDLMDHRSIDTTMGYYSVGDAKKRAAMELLARHTIDNRGTVRPLEGEPSRVAQLREELSWVAVPMGKCSEPTNVRAGGGACPIRYQCAGCPHFESDPSYLPELMTYADQLRQEREAMIAVGAAEWIVANVTGQLEIIVGHVRRHEALLERLGSTERAAVEHASATLRKSRQAVPVAFGRRKDRPS